MAPISSNDAVLMPSGYKIPIVGFGVYQTPRAQCQAIVTHALKTGYRHIDSAGAYRNERPCAISMHVSDIPRSEIFFTTKIRPGMLGHGVTKEQIAGSLKETGLEYIDLILIHAPYGGSEARKGAWLALREAQKAGKVRSIGVSNYGVHHLNELEAYIKELDAREPGSGGRIDVGQWELHPWLMRPDIVQWCRERDVVIEAYSPLVRGTRWGEPTLAKLAKKYGRTEAQILTRWSLQKGFVPLPKTVDLGRVEKNFQVFDWELEESDAASLDTKDYEPCTWDPTTSND